MLLPLKVDLFPDDASRFQERPSRPNWRPFLRHGSLAGISFGRDSMTSVVPHSCRFGAGYKSNERPRAAGSAPGFSMRCIVPESTPPTERTRVLRESQRGVYDRESIYKILDEGF